MAHEATFLESIRLLQEAISAVICLVCRLLVSISGVELSTFLLVLEVNTDAVRLALLVLLLEELLKQFALLHVLHAGGDLACHASRRELLLLLMDLKGMVWLVLPHFRRRVVAIGETTSLGILLVLRYSSDMPSGLLLIVDHRLNLLEALHDLRLQRIRAIQRPRTACAAKRIRVAGIDILLDNLPRHLLVAISSPVSVLVGPLGLLAVLGRIQVAGVLSHPLALQIAIVSHLVWFVVVAVRQAFYLEVLVASICPILPPVVQLVAWPRQVVLINFVFRTFGLDLISVRRPRTVLHARKRLDAGHFTRAVGTVLLLVEGKARFKIIVFVLSGWICSRWSLKRVRVVKILRNFVWVASSTVVVGLLLVLVA